MSMPEVYNLTKTPAAAERATITFRWPDGVRCPEPHCGSENIRLRRCNKRPNELPVRFFCQDCRKHFTVRTRYFLRHSSKCFVFWCWAIYLVAATGSDPVTPASLTRLLDVTSTCAADIIKRIREHIRDTGGGAEAL